MKTPPSVSVRPERLVIEAPAAYPTAAAGWIASTIEAVVAARGRCTVALAGGSTPRPVYRTLATQHAHDVPWAAVEVFFGDERCVPPDHPESNFAMAEAALLRHAPIPRSQVHRLEGEHPSPEAAAQAYEAILPAQLDLLLLGMGPDGHTASLFPHAPALDEVRRRVVPAESPVPPRCRLTITPPVIREARQIAVLVTGAAKAPAVQRALEGPWDPHRLPIQLAIRGVWLLDQDAAAMLGQGGA